MTGKREARLVQLARALATLDDAALLDAWKEAVAIREAARPDGRSGDEPGLRAAICEDIAAQRFGAGRHAVLYAGRHGVAPESPIAPPHEASREALTLVKLRLPPSGRG